EATGWPSANFKGGKAELLAGLSENSAELASFIATKDNSFLESAITYKNTKGIEFNNKVEDILYHVVNHASFHRGQLVTMLRQLGFDKFPPQDLIAYIRELK
ncbi:MAG TPA: DinB family protein, partial [Chitinophagales bacterium]|nr:DinB family protein [Chitinophagales bacterium]